MKTGVIIYIVGKKNPSDDFDVTEAVDNLGINADRVELVSCGSGHFDVMDAWWSLTAKGMKNIVCKIGEIENHSRIRLTGRELRLCG